MIRNHTITLLMDEYSHRFKNNWESTCSAEKPACPPATCLPASQPAGIPSTEYLRPAHRALQVIQKITSDLSIRIATSLYSTSLRQRIHLQPTSLSAATF